MTPCSGFIKEVQSVDADADADAETDADADADAARIPLA